jgi:hypothetical protein
VGDTERPEEPAEPEGASVVEPAKAPKRSYESVLQAVGAVAGLGLVVALVGGAVVWERLHTLHLAANPIAAELPRSLFFVVGARVLAFPVVLAAATAFLAWIAGQRPARDRLHAHETAVRRAATVVVASAFIVAAIVIAMAVTTHHKTFILVEQSLFIAAVVVAAAAAIAVAARGNRELTVRWFAWTFVLVGSFCAIVEMIDIARPPVKLEFARVELVRGGAREGFFVGQNSGQVYLAPAARGCAVLGWIEAIPQSRVRLLSVVSSRNAYRRNARCKPKRQVVQP